MTTPLSMFIIGAMLADVKLKDMFNDFPVYYANFIKLIAAPIIVYFALRLLGAEKTLLYICVILASMPTASLIGVLAERYNVNKEIASKCAFLTTILSMITIPAVISLMDLLTK
jgi:predicted permease